MAGRQTRPRRGIGRVSAPPLREHATDVAEQLEQPRSRGVTARQGRYRADGFGVELEELAARQAEQDGE